MQASASGTVSLGDRGAVLYNDKGHATGRLGKGDHNFTDRRANLLKVAGGWINMEKSDVTGIKFN
ncbi:hypothetical protein ACFCXT_23305 [Streptomyces vinaceus]|uniref:hypothetical protein n=1 Tax=Streptomyces vinaceus TaxID=1960 RepID=UPI0035E15444